ncbi:MAG TPA: hypothetical protein ENJ30_05800 [Desulfobulbaceae bacterium]|nr:hypothetical protein [Desulfobulbaceae bacterium]
MVDHSVIADKALKSTDLIVRYSLDIDCPYCGAELDLSDQDDENGRFSSPIFNNRWEDLVGDSVKCPDCAKEFIISNVGF